MAYDRDSDIVTDLWAMSITVVNLGIKGSQERRIRGGWRGFNIGAQCRPPGAGSELTPVSLESRLPLRRSHSDNPGEAYRSDVG